MKSNLEQTRIAGGDPAEWLGDLHPLVKQLGSAEGLVTLENVCALLHAPGVNDRAGLCCFLGSYRDQLLLPLELPVIRQAFEHASRNEARELIELDRSLAAEPTLKPFASASRRVGQAQLQRLRPLRDERLVQRYITAVDEAVANGWHTIVYGATLAIYSLPLRPGLYTYAQNTLRGFVHAAARSLRLNEDHSAELLEASCAVLPVEIEKLLAA